MMKKIRWLLLITLLLCSMLIFPSFTESVNAIGLHEVADGVVSASIFCDTYGATGLYTGSHWDVSGQDDTPYSITTDGTNLFVLGNENEEVYKYSMAGGYISSWDTSAQGYSVKEGITTDGTNIWIVQALDPTVFKYNMAGGFINSWNPIVANGAPYDITTDGTNIWLVDRDDDKVYKYSMAGAYISVWDISSQIHGAFTITTDGVHIWIPDYSDEIVYKYDMTENYVGSLDISVETEGAWGMATDGTNTWILSWSDLEVYKYDMVPNFDVTRDAGVATESNKIFSFNPTINCTGNVILKVPVSTSVKGIIDVTNNTNDILAVEVNNSGELINNTFWYDSANQFVHIRTINLTTSTTVNWTVNCSYGATFWLDIPPYLNAGDQFTSSGLITNSTGHSVSGFIATTHILYANGTDARNPLKTYCDPNYFCTFSTALLIPGTYSVSIEFTDPDSGIVFKEGGILYLSTDPGSGVHVSTFLHFTFYNNNTKIGMPSESFKIYASVDTTVDSDDRIFVDLYGVYTGQTIYYRIDDYFDNQIYPTSGDYETLAITSINQFEDIPIDWYSFSVKNMNHSIVKFNMTNASRTYTQFLFPYEPFYWDILAGEYTINLTYHNAVTDVVEYYNEENITINDDTYYWIRGYDLRDIIIEITLVNTSLDSLSISITSDITALNSNVTSITTNIISNLTLTESNLTTLINSYSSNYTIIESVVNFLNNTIWSNFTTVGSVIDTINNKLTIDFDLLNVTVDFLNNTIWSNFTTVGSDIDTLSVSVHTNLEVSETNISNIIFDVWSSFNLSNVTIDFLNASIWNEIDIINSNLNFTNLTITNMIRLTENNISTLIITISNIIDYALMPDIEIVVFNPPMVFSVYDKEGMAIGGNIYKICPALIVIATTKIETYGNWINSTARVPGNDTVENGTITILKDSLYISGSGAINWINITYADNGTLMQNTTYIPSKINLYGQNLTINASADIHILRETKYNQVTKFYWTQDADTGKHTTGISVINPMTVPIYDVYVYVEFSNQSTPNPNTVVMRDVSNDGVILKTGENYDIGLISIHFYLLSIDSDTTRGFIFEYYKRFDDAYRYGEETVSVSGYIETVWNGLSFNKCIISYINNENTIFRGGLYASLNFDVPTEINGNSIRIWDENNNHELNDSCFIDGSGFVRIDASGLGDVAPGGGRRFNMYFLLREYPGADPTELHLNTPIWMGITPFLIIFIIGAIIVAYGIYDYIFNKNKNWWKIIILGVFIIFIFYILAYMGV